MMFKIYANPFLIIALEYLVYYTSTCRADLFFETSDIESLVDPSEIISNALNRFIDEEQKKIDELISFSNRLSRHKEFKQTDISAVHDSLNFYLLTKTLVAIQEQLRVQIDIQDYRVISADDQISAAAALFRLQDTYALNTKDVANGNLSTDFAETEKLRMTAFDCFQLGKIAFDLDPPDYYHALLWIQEAHDRMRTEKRPTVDEKNVLVYLSIALYQQDNLERAALSVMRLKKLDPNFPKVDENLKQYTKELKAKNIILDNLDLDRRLPNLRLTKPKVPGFPDLDVYERLCRGELTPVEQKSKKLFCFYKMDTKFLKLAPLKAELLHFNPRIVVYRKAISKNEADSIKRMARSKLKRSTISTITKIDVAKHRTSKTAWLENKDDPSVEALSKRVQDMTGLTCATAENFQVANYELGGHYMPHVDYAGEEKDHQFANLGTGDRLATVLFYLAETKAGGATVFPNLRLTVYPQENDALFWFNLKLNGQGDSDTRHAACPVLMGVKWISNKWLHEYGQEFRRPCGLREED